MLHHPHHLQREKPKKRNNQPVSDPCLADFIKSFREQDMCQEKAASVRWDVSADDADDADDTQEYHEDQGPDESRADPVLDATRIERAGSPSAVADEDDDMQGRGSD